MKWALGTNLWNSFPGTRFTDILDVMHDTGFIGVRLTQYPQILTKYNLTEDQMERELSRRGFVGGAAGSLAALGLFPPARAAGATPPIVFANFQLFDGTSGTLRQGLAAQLDQSPFLSLISDERIAQTLALMQQPKEARLTPQLAREVCQRTSSAATSSTVCTR